MRACLLSLAFLAVSCGAAEVPPAADQGGEPTEAQLRKWVEALGAGKFFDLALACETFDPDRIEAAADRRGVEVSEVNTRHFEAMAWVQALQV
jgi:hypothetical protein